MPTNNFPGVGFVTVGYDRNFYQKLSVSWTAFGANAIDGVQPDMLITFKTHSVQMINLGSAGTVEYSFNGQVVHGEMTYGATNANLIFDNRVISRIWFRLQSGTAGPVTVSVQSWNNE